MTDAGSAPPERLGPYRIDRRLGRGGMGEVFLASDERLGRPVAIKRIRRDARPGAEARERLRREARAVARLNHPAIIQVYDVIEAGGCDWIVLEYVPGASLAEIMVARSLGVARALDLARQVAEGLAHAHDRGILHRDLKAENVRVTPDGRAKILDLGLAKLFAARAAGEGEDDGSLTRQGAIVGTPRAMAPEQAAGGPVDSRADLFSFGVLLYELLGGCSPFQAPSAAATLRKVLGERPAPLRDLRPELPEELSDLVAELLAPVPADRPAGAAEVARRLARLTARPEIATLGAPSPLASSPGLSQAPTGGPVSRPVVPRLRAAGSGLRRWLRVVAVTATLALGAVILVVFGLPGRRGPLPSLVVAVSNPQMTSGGSDEAALAGSAVADAMVEGLISLEGIEVVDPAESAELSGSPEKIIRSAGADEVASARLSCRDEWCRVALLRLSGAGRVVATAHPFDVSTRPDDLPELAAAVRVRLADLYPEHPPRREGSVPKVRLKDYAAYHQIRRREAAGERLGNADLVQLEELLETSPGFVEGHLLAARLARTLNQPDTVRLLADRAAELAPWDPRPLAALARLAIEAGPLQEAEKAVARLESAAPGDLAAKVARARLLGRQNRQTEAVEAWQVVVAKRPSWEHLYWLARQERDAGLPKDALAHVEELLRRSPDNEFGFTLLADLDARAGRLDRAAATYRQLIGRNPQHLYSHGLGWVLFLQGRHAEAIESYQKALDLVPGHRRTRFNLAATYLATGQLERARALYQEVLADFETAGEATVPGASDILIRAQCLAHLDRFREAVALTDQTLTTEHPDEAQFRYQAAHVYALVGDRYSAVHNVRVALEKGLSPAWFAIPAFDGLRSDPEFRDLVGEREGSS